jgi:E3 ubiquitin-protein ligase TRIP12
LLVTVALFHCFAIFRFNCVLLLFQRVAVSIAANICRQLPSDAADFVTEAIPLLTNLLQYQDSKVVEHASVCLMRIAEASATSSEKLDVLCSHGLIPQAARLISVSNTAGSLVPQTSLSTSTYTVLIRLLSTCASGSAAAAESLLQLRISSILKNILAGSGLVSSTSVSPSSVNRPPEQLYEIVTLVNELLPTTPDTQGNQVSPTSIVGTSSRGAGRKYSAVTIGKVEESGQGATPEISAREMLLRNQPELLLQFGTDLFPMLVQVRDYWTYHLFILVFLASTFLVETNVVSLLWE